jgi:hypothetical protein
VRALARSMSRAAQTIVAAGQAPVSRADERSRRLAARKTPAADLGARAAGGGPDA